jgi:hypothetical protein
MRIVIFFSCPIGVSKPDSASAGAGHSPQIREWCCELCSSPENAKFGVLGALGDLVVRFLKGNHQGAKNTKITKDQQRIAHFHRRWRVDGPRSVTLPSPGAFSTLFVNSENTSSFGVGYWGNQSTETTTLTARSPSNPRDMFWGTGIASTFPGMEQALAAGSSEGVDSRWRKYG